MPYAVTVFETAICNHNFFSSPQRPARPALPGCYWARFNPSDGICPQHQTAPDPKIAFEPLDSWWCLLHPPPCWSEPFHQNSSLWEVHVSWCQSLKYFRFLNCLLSCVMVRLGPEDSTRLIPVRLEVVERSTSQYTVTIIKSENFEGRRLFACGSFDKLGHSIKLPKFVSLSLFALLLIFSKGPHIALFDVAFVHVTV